MPRSTAFLFSIAIVVISAAAALGSGLTTDIVESAETYIVFDVRIDSVDIVQSAGEASWVTDIQIDGCAFTDEEGKPRLPVTSVVLGIPPDGSPRLSIVSENSVTRSVGDIVTVQNQTPWEKEGAEKPTGWRNSWYPQKSADLGITGFLRSQRIAQIQVYPVQYLGSSGMARILKFIRLRLDFDKTAAGSTNRNKSFLNDNFDPVIASIVANNNEAKKWRRNSGPARANVESAEAPYRYKLYLKEDGIYAVTGEMLQRHGADLRTIDPATLALTNKGRPVPILVEGWSDNSFDVDDRIVFIGEHNSGENSYFNYYSDTNVYLLSWGGAGGARFAEISGVAPDSNADTTNVALNKIHMEYDVIYERLLVTPYEEQDHWFWKLLTIGEEFPLRIPSDHIVQDKPLRIQVGMHGLTYLPADPDHRVYIKINEELIAEAQWDNQTAYVMDTGFVQPERMNEENELKISLPGGLYQASVDNILLNWIEFDLYEKLYAKNDAITFMDQDPQAEVLRIDGFSNAKNPYILSTAGYLITNAQVQRNKDSYSLFFADPSANKGRYFVATEEQFRSVNKIAPMGATKLKKPENGADYILITHPAFMGPAQKLADFRSAQNLRTKVVNIYDIYDEFGYGLYTPEAIRHFVKYAYENWVRPAPLYLLLFGDTTHRMAKDIAHETNFKTFVPSMMEYTFSWGMTSSDNYFVAVSGDDYLPDLFVGRIPVNNESEANTVVQKIIDYESKPVIDDWRRNVFLLSGNNNFFESSSLYLYENIIPRRFVTNILSTLTESPYFGSTEDMVARINKGQSIVNFIGHGGGGVFFDSQLFLTEDIERLNNKDRYPIAFSMTCFIGHFDNPDMASLAEELLRAPDKGIVAHFGSAGRAYLFGDFFLNNALFDAVYNRGARRIGEITTMGKLGMVEKTKGYFDHVKNYILMGDPAMRVVVVEDNIDLKIEPRIVKAGDLLKVSGTVAGASAGNVILSLYNESDSLLTQKLVSVQSGRFSADLVSLTDDYLRAWPQGAGVGMVRAYFYNDETDAASYAEFVVNQPRIPQVATVPESPFHLQEFFFKTEIDPADYEAVNGIDSVWVQWSVNGVEWNEISLFKDQSNFWQTELPLQKPEGSPIYYRLQLKAGDGSSAIGSQQFFRVGYRPELFILPESITVAGSSTPMLSFVVRNSGGKDSGPFSIMAFEGKVVGAGKQIGDKLLVDNLAPEADTTITILWSNATAGWKDLHFRLDVENQVDESNESNNLTQTQLAIATVSSGTGGKLSAADGSFFIEAASGTLAANASFRLVNSDDSEFLSAAKGHSLVPVALKSDSVWQACQILFADSSVTTVKNVKVGVYINSADSVSHMHLAQGDVKIYAWNRDGKSWQGLSSQIETASGLVTADLPAGVHTFAAFASSDGQPPTINVAVEGQNFVDGDYVGPKPSIVIRLEDASGFDTVTGPVKLFLDGSEVSAENYVLFQQNGSATTATITYSPDLLSGSHDLKIEAADINGNKSVAELTMTVAGEFGLAAIANHPNPFADETVIAFTLTDMAEEVTIGIYTVSGRLIRSFRYSDISGYHEQEWDGLDEDGNEIANGVYYLKFTAKNGDKKIEKIEKMAKLL